MKKIAIIGAGPSGALAAIMSKTEYNEVTIFEKNNCLGKKLAITGNGRCNITNAQESSTFLDNVTTNKKFLYSSFNSFTNKDLMKFLKNKGLKLKVEDDLRVFPKSESSSFVIDLLERLIKEKDIVLKTNTLIKNIKKDGDKFLLSTQAGTYYFDIVVVATGGLSYPSTGSTGDGYRFAKSFGLDVKNTYPSLTPIYIKDNLDIKALSLDNVSLSIKDNKSTYTMLGQMLLTRNFITGPIVLKLQNLVCDKQITDISIDLLPDLDHNEVDLLLLDGLKLNSKKNIRNILNMRFQDSLSGIILKKSFIKGDTKAFNINAKQRKILLKNIKELKLNFKGFGSYKNAIITKGGVSVKELNPKTMQAKKLENLYFIGEVIDVNASTGGYNLQIAFSSAYQASLDIRSKM